MYPLVKDFFSAGSSWQSGPSYAFGDRRSAKQKSSLEVCGSFLYGGCLLWASRSSLLDQHSVPCWVSRMKDGIPVLCCVVVSCFGLLDWCCCAWWMTHANQWKEMDGLGPANHACYSEWRQDGDFVMLTSEMHWNEIRFVGSCVIFLEVTLTRSQPRDSGVVVKIWMERTNRCEDENSHW